MSNSNNFISFRVFTYTPRIHRFPFSQFTFCFPFFSFHSSQSSCFASKKWPVQVPYLPKPCSSLVELPGFQCSLPVGESGLPWAAFFQTGLKLFLHNSNRMLLVLLETEYNKVRLTSIKNSIFKRYIIVIFDSLKCCICHTIPYRWCPLCHSIRYIVTGCVKDTLKCETWIIFKDNDKITVYYYYIFLAIN